MSGLACNSCNKELKDDTEQRLHYKSEWHRYNLKRKVAGVPGVTEALFLARQAALAQEKNGSKETPMLYSCGLCGKGRAGNKPPPKREENDEESEESGDEWEEVDPEDELVSETAKSLTDLNVDGHASNEDMDEDDEDEDDYEELDPSCCFMCDREHKTIESCMVHMHKHHGFFIPDIEYLKDPKGLLTYLGLKVKRDFMCLYCNDRCQPFNSLEAEEFYDYSSSYVDEAGKQLVVSGEMANSVELGSGGSELIITTRSDEGISSKALGSREFMRYYRQKPRPSPNHMAITAAVAARYKSMGLATVQSKERMVQLKVLKEMRRSGVEAMRSKIGMKSNVIRNLPKNVTF
ncbi:hypothetical protein M0R45_012223 [Rubus argutus]|uniref:C2H2-type domain-containing protein n=1 Tax=Rubus argutus TaxID=59490 RepID=A0AAW1YDC2_RUBAR